MNFKLKKIQCRPQNFKKCKFLKKLENIYEMVIKNKIKLFVIKQNVMQHKNKREKNKMRYKL